MSDRAAAELARHPGFDVAIDLTGHTRGSRTGALAHRLAPVQIAHLGYPGTIGATFIDYLIADVHVIPPTEREHYAERLLLMPGSFQPNDDQRPLSSEPLTRAQFGLPETGFVFCCFNNNYKITPELFDLWMRLLHKVPDSVLWLLSDNPKVVENLQREANARGISPERLVFAPRANVAEHLARQKAADLFLDTIPCNAHTTASDALWVGLPVLTCTGTSFASRVAASLLMAQGLDELVTDNLGAYEGKALELAQDPGKMRTLRRKTEEAIETGLLFNTPELTRAIERSFEQAYGRAHEGKEPDHIDV